MSRSHSDRLRSDRMGANEVDTEAILAILEDKRAEVLSRERAGYFIHDWQEISDQVRQMIGQDPRYQQSRPRKRQARV